MAQMEIVVRMEFEPFVEPIFCEDSYGYRPNKSARRSGDAGAVLENAMGAGN